MRVGTRTWDGAQPEALAAELRALAPDPSAVAADVAKLIERVRSGGDDVLRALSRKLDGAEPRALQLGPDDLAAALSDLDDGLRDALELAARNIEAVARDGLDLAERTTELPQGHRVTSGRVPVAAAGIYAPGGRAVYPSSVLMGAIPARVAGVERIVVASPPQEDGVPAPALLAAAAIAGAGAVVVAGGAHAIAALAYGTETIESVDVIAGPGGPWVQEAKLQVSRVVGIDGYAGPSELAVICDAGARTDWIALDLLAQAEHGADSPLTLIGTDPKTLERIAKSVAELAPGRPSVADASLEVVQAPDLEAAAALARALAPEHLQLDCADPERIAALVPTAGCAFVGSHSATAFGDYAAGSNHTLPTGGAGAFSGPLGVETFTRRTSRVELDASSARALAAAVDAIARAEGLPVHGESARARADADDPADGSS